MAPSTLRGGAHRSAARIGAGAAPSRLVRREQLHQAAARSDAGVSSNGDQRPEAADQLMTCASSSCYRASYAEDVL